MRRPPLPVRLLTPLAFRAWFIPPPLGPRAALRDAEAVEGLDRVSLGLADGREVPAYAAGEGPMVLALHGWGGRPAQMSGIVERLAGEGMRVVAPELPGRPASGMTDIRQAAAVIQEVAAAAGPPRMVVAHSFAALALRLVDWEAVPPQVVMAAPLLKLDDVLDGFSIQARLAPWVAGGLRRRLQAWDPDLFARLEGVEPGSLPDSEVLILHDPDDPQAPFSSAAVLAALRPGTALVPVAGAGHNGILRHPRSLDRLAAFLTGSAPRLAADG